MTGKEPGADGKTVISGVVTLSGGPKAGLGVLLDRSGTVLVQTTTDASGAYRLQMKEGGSYRVDVEIGKSGGAICYAIDVTEVKKGKQTTLDFKLLSSDTLPSGPGEISLGLSGTIYRCDS